MTIQQTKPVEAATDFSNGAAYVNGEFVGGADIVTELYGNGQLATTLENAFNPR